MYFDLVMQMKKQLAQMDTWLEKANALATEKKFDPNVFLTARLAPDQFAFARQVQVSCGGVTGAVAMLTGREAKSFPEDQTTLDELRALVKATVEHLGSVTAKDFEGAATRTISQPRWQGKTMTGHDFFVEHVVPNFFFHLAHTYAILRHNGVPLGKMDYLGARTMKAPA